jgi:hypothetical protein
MALVNLLTYMLTFRTYHIAQAPGSKSQEITRTAVPRLPTIQDLGLLVLDRMRWKVYAPNGYGHTVRLVTRPSIGEMQATSTTITTDERKSNQLHFSNPKRSNAPIPCVISLHNSHQDNTNKENGTERPYPRLGKQFTHA